MEKWVRSVVDADKMSCTRCYHYCVVVSSEEKGVHRDHRPHSPPRHVKLQRLWSSLPRAFVAYIYCSAKQHKGMRRREGYKVRTAFSAVIKSCKGLSSWFPPKAGMVELCAIFLNIVVVNV